MAHNVHLIKSICFRLATQDSSLQQIGKCKTHRLSVHHADTQSFYDMSRVAVPLFSRTFARWNSTAAPAAPKFTGAQIDQAVAAQGGKMVHATELIAYETSIHCYPSNDLYNCLQTLYRRS